jgi:hypothetical protein
MAEIKSGADEVEHQEHREAGHMDIGQNVATYHFFLKLTKWSLIVIAAILIFMAIFLT